MAFRSVATYRLTALQDDSTVGGNTPSKYLWFQYSSSCAGSARRTRREKAARAAVPGSRLSATIGAPSSQKRRLRRKMCATSSMSSAAMRPGCTTIASARSSGTAGSGMSSAIAMQRSMLARRISEEDREGRLDTGRGLLGAPIGKQVLALEDDERPGLVGEAEDADVDRRLRRRLVVVFVALDQIEPADHLLHRLQVETPLPARAACRLLEGELAHQLERATLPERVEAGQVAPAALVSGRGATSFGCFARAGQSGERQVRAGDRPSPEARVLQASADGTVLGLGGPLDVEVVRELPVQRIGERAAAREAGAKEHRPGDVWIEGQPGRQRPGRRPHQRPGVDLVPAPDGGEELADPQVEPVEPRQVAEQSICGEGPAFLAGVLLVDRVDLREEVQALQRIPDDEEVQALDPEGRRATFVVDKVNRAVAGQGQTAVTDAQATAGRVGHVADRRRQRQRRGPVGTGRIWARRRCR